MALSPFSAVSRTRAPDTKNTKNDGRRTSFVWAHEKETENRLRVIRLYLCTTKTDCRTQ